MSDIIYRVCSFLWFKIVTAVWGGGISVGCITVVVESECVCESCVPWD